MGKPQHMNKISPSVSIFKKRYLGFYRVESSPIFRIHDPSGLKYLTRLRLGLSHLKEYKYNGTFKDTQTPYCDCNNYSFESIEHFFPTALLEFWRTTD